MDTKNNLTKDFESLEKTLNGEKGSSFHATRKKALSYVIDNGLPEKKDEEYKYTPISKIFVKEVKELLLANLENTKVPEVELPFVLSDCVEVKVVNGKLASVSENIDSVKGINIFSYQEALKNNGSKIPNELNQTKSFKDQFEALNVAFSQDGVVIETDSNVVIQPTIFVINYFTVNDSSWISSKNLYKIGENSEVKIVELNIAVDGSEYFVNVASEVYSATNSRLNLVKIQNENKSVSRIDNSTIVQKKDSLVNAFTFTFDGKMVRNNLTIKLEDEHCEAHMFGLYVVDNQTHVDNHTTVDHIEPNSFSNEVYKGILSENAKGVFNGKIYVRPDAQQTNAFQSNKNILLDDSASINTKPQLEIWADDVKCSHGCTVGQLNEEQLYYLRARGINERRAKALLLHAFASDVLAELKQSEIREYLDDLITQKLHQ